MDPMNLALLTSVASVIGEEMFKLPRGVHTVLNTITVCSLSLFFYGML